MAMLFLAPIRSRRRGALLAAAVIAALAAARPAAAAAAAAAAPPAPILRTHASVAGAQVRLGDVFLNAGAAADAVIADAPAAGRQLVLPVATLARLARGHGLAWRPLTGGEQTVIERDSIAVDEAWVIGLLQDGLAAKGLPAGLAIELATALASVRVPAAAQLAVENLAYSPAGRRFTAMLAVLDDGRPVQRLPLTGQVYRVISVPVAARDVRHGEVIGHADLDWLSLRDSLVPANAVLDADALVGLTPRRVLKTGAPIATGDVGRPVLVAKGAPVTMVLKTAAMTLTARGRALDAGGAGDWVRIANAGSRAVVEGVVTAAGEVSVGAPAADGMAGR